MNSSPLKSSTHRPSPLMQAQVLRHGGSLPHKGHKEMAPVLPLTSLIDAFSIIVIYLLIGTQTSGIEANMPKGLNLPIADAATAIDKESPIIRVEKGQYFINDQYVATSELGKKLYELKKTLPKPEEAEILIQADVQMDYADLDPLLKAGSEAGIQKLKFAVLPTK